MHTYIYSPIQRYTYIFIYSFQSNSDGPVTSRPPSSFQKPRDRFETGMIQLNSQYNPDFQPPMPRPPLFATW